MKIRTQFLLVPAVYTAVLAGLAVGFGYTASVQQRVVIGFAEQSLGKINEFGKSFSMLTKVQLDFLSLLVRTGGEIDELEIYELGQTKLDELSALLARFQAIPSKYSLTPAERQLYDQAQTALTQYQKMVISAVRTASVDTSQVAKFIVEANGYQATVAEDFLQLSDEIRDSNEASLRRLFLILRQQTVMLLIAMGGIFCLLFWLSIQIADRMSEPILGLAKLAQRISKERDYSLRTTLNRENELGILANGLNAMLEQIQAQDGSLRQARDELERRVTERTNELSKYTQKLERSNKELDEFTYIISHDLKEPLRSIDAFSKFVVDDYQGKLDPEGLGYLERIRANAKRMQQLIEDLLQVSRLSQRPNELQVANLNEMIEELKGRFEYVMVEKQVQLVIPEPLPTLTCDRVRIAEVFANLMSNAIKYSDKPKPRVELRCRLREDGCYQFSVADNGPGIEPQYFEKIFEIFQRLGKKEAHEGTGVGLTIVKKIVELHKGEIWVESKLGEGTTFHFTIPKDQAVTPSIPGP